MTAKNRRFIEEFLVDLNPRAAAQRAGYAAAVGYNLLYKPEIADAVAEAQAERARRTGIGVDRVVRELAAIAFSDIRNAVSWRAQPLGPKPAEDEGEDDGGEDDEREDDGGEEGGDRRAKYQMRVKDSAQIDEATAAAICEVRRYSWGAVRVKLHDKLGALALLGRHLGMFVDRHEITDGRGEALAQREMRAAIEPLSPEQRAALRVAIKAVVDMEPQSRHLDDRRRDA